MKTMFLTDWEIAAIEAAIRLKLQMGSLHKEHGEALLNKLEHASHIRLSFKTSAP